MDFFATMMLGAAVHFGMALGAALIALMIFCTLVVAVFAYDVFRMLKTKKRERVERYA